MSESRLAERATEPRYTFTEAASVVRRPPETVRRWSRGNRRQDPNGRSKVDNPLIEMDGSAARGALALSFLNVLELQMLASYRGEAALQAIRSALDYAARELNAARPLLTQEFSTMGGHLFTKFMDTGAPGPSVVNATKGGQIAFDEIAAEATRDVDYADGIAYRWWLMSRSQPLFVASNVAGGMPVTAETAVRVDAIEARSRQGMTRAEISYDTGASNAEVGAALSLHA